MKDLTELSYLLPHSCFINDFFWAAKVWLGFMARGLRKDGYYTFYS